MKKIIRGVLIGLLCLTIVAVPALSAYYSYIVTENTGTDYTQLALNMTLDIQYLVDEGYITASGLDTRVTDADYVVLPHMLAQDRFLWVSDLAANSTTQFIFWTDQTALSSFPTITGHGGYVTIVDTAALEPGGTYAFGVIGYMNMTAGTNTTIIRKDGACVLNVSSTNSLTWTVVGGNSTTAYNVTSGYHTVMVYSDAVNMWMEVDDVSAGNVTASTVPNTANDWYLFENNCMPYVAYYGEWVVP